MTRYWRTWFSLCVASLMSASAVLAAASESGQRPRQPLDPRGEIHVPIGIANAVDTLKTFVEAEGNFSPGFATYGIYVWVYDPAAKKLTAPTMDGVACTRGLAESGYLIPWSQWAAGQVSVRTEVCQAARASPAGDVQVVAARVHLTNRGSPTVSVSLYAALRPLGAAGGPVRELAVSDAGDALLVDRHPALVAAEKPTAAGVLAGDTIGQLALAGAMPAEIAAQSDRGDCSGALRFDLELPGGQTRTLSFLCPVLTGRRAAGHDWDGVSLWAQLDLAQPNPPRGGALQPDPGLDYYRHLAADAVFAEATAYWQDLASRVTLQLPDARWVECFRAIIGHAAMSLNNGAPDVAVINYNVFNRDGVYVANILQKAGRLDLSAAAVDYFLAHPFNGRTRVEADNPGQILWVMGEQWQFGRDRQWLQRVYPSAAKIAAMIRYCRTTPGPHWVKATSLEFGDDLPPDQPGERPAQRRQVLKPGSCDGQHPEYTEAFDIAGLHAASQLAKAIGKADEAAKWDQLATQLLAEYDQQFGQRLPAAYGSYSVLWPCRLYPLTSGPAYEQFRNQGATSPGGWRYFALASAHQGLLAGNREAGYRTIANHLQHPQMAGWYAFDEGGNSGPGGWKYARTNWNPSVAMPHGWAIAELWLLLRDSLLYEDGDRLVLLAGVPPEWFRTDKPVILENVPTHFGACSLRYEATANRALLDLSTSADPPGGFVLCLPAGTRAKIAADGRAIPQNRDASCVLPPACRKVVLDSAP